MSRRTGAVLALAAAALATALALAAVEAPASASVPSVPLSSPAPGSPIFVSYRATFDPSRHTTSFEITATGAGLAYVWSLEGQTCGTLVDPAGRTARNGYFHRDCAFEEETAARVSVLVARAADLGSDGRPRSDDVARFVYSQVVRAGDSPDTRTLDPKASLQYVGPPPGGPPVPTTAPPDRTLVPPPTAVAAASGAAGATSTPTPAPSAGPGPDLVAILGGILIAASIVGFHEWAARRDPCDLLDDLCDRAHAQMRRAEEARSRASDAADRARAALREATAERERAEATAGDRPPFPYETGAGRDPELLAEARRAGEQRRSVESGSDFIERLRARARAAHEATRESASATLEAARAREASARVERDAAEDAQRAAEAAYAKAVELHQRICAAAEACVRPARPVAPTPPTPPTMVEPVRSPREDVRPGDCCPGRYYYGILAVVETCSLPVVTKLVDVGRYLIWGETYTRSWLATGHEQWSGTFYCAGDESKFVTIEATAERFGLGLGAGGGVMLAFCDGYEHPQEVVEKIPLMMAGWAADIVVPGAATGARAASGTTMRAIASAIRRLADRVPPRLAEVLRGIGRGPGASGVVGDVASRVAGAEGCEVAPVSLTLQGGIWHVNAEDVTCVILGYGCCSACDRPSQDGAGTGRRW